MVNRPLPALPDPGDTDWEDWAAGIHDAVASAPATYATHDESLSNALIFGS